ncbi:hypothetical protein E4G67_00930 [Candidatus Bathyarchaeota archaeon]|nr:MAG: hypothetical protein E4G67_00930 [Candidatus Bathyarchaeota archaeon]
MTENDLTIALSEGVLAELSEAIRIHPQLDMVLTSLPSALVKTGEMILQEEVQSYPEKRIESLFLYPLNHLIGTNFLKDYLSSSGLVDARLDQRSFAGLMGTRHEEMKKNFPPKSSHGYTRKQAKEFAWYITYQWLLNQHRIFIEQFTDNLSNLKVEVFQSIQLRSSVQFYKYYLGRRTPKTSDFGDLFHLSYLPYCETAILEKDLGETLRQIKQREGILENVRIENLDFIRKLKKENSIKRIYQLHL